MVDFVSNLYLNYLPLRFTSDVFYGSTLKFDTSANSSLSRNDQLWQKLAELRENHNKTHLFHAIGNKIHCVPVEKTEMVIGEPQEFDIFNNFQLANAVARRALLSFFQSKSKPITKIRPVSVLLHDHNLSSHRQDVFGFFPQYSFDVRPLAPHEGPKNKWCSRKLLNPISISKDGGRTHQGRCSG